MRAIQDALFDSGILRRGLALCSEVGARMARKERLVRRFVTGNITPTRFSRNQEERDILCR